MTLSSSKSKIKISTILVLICCVFTVPVAIHANLSVFTPVSSNNVALLPSNYSTCPTSNHVAHSDFPYFPMGNSIPTYEMTFLSTDSPSWKLNVPKALLQSDYKSFISTKNSNDHGVIRMVEPSNLLELITRMPSILVDINLPNTITIPLVTQTFADILAEIFNGKDHHYHHPITSDKKHTPIYSELVNVWNIVVFASDQAANLFDRNDKPLSDAGINPNHLRNNPFPDKRIINIHKLLKLIRERAKNVRKRMLNDPKLSPIQDIIERIDGLGYLFSNFNGGSESINLDAINSYAMSLRDFARSIDRHLIRLQNRSNNNIKGSSIRHDFTLTTLNRRYGSIDSFKQFLQRPKSTLTGGFAIDQQSNTTPVNQLTVPAVNGGPVIINRLNECAINSVSFKLLVNDKLFITVPSQVPNQLSNSVPIPHHIYQWTVPSDQDPIDKRTASIKTQNGILDSIKSTHHISWRLEASSITTGTTNCPQVPIIPYVFNGVLACQAKKINNNNSTTTVPIQSNNNDTQSRITEQNRIDKAKCQTRCSGSCRSRCEDMCEDRCDMRFGTNTGRPCSTCNDSCALTNPIMRRACSSSGSITSTSTGNKVKSNLLFSIGDNLEEQQILGDDSIITNDFDYLHDTLTDESLDDFGFSIDDGFEEDSLDDFDFSIDDGLYEDTLDEADFAFGDEFLELEDLI